MGWVEETVDSIQNIQIRIRIPFRHDRNVCADHMEGADVHYRERIPRSRRSLRKHGAWFQEGDNNDGDCRLLYAKGQLWPQRLHIMGRFSDLLAVCRLGHHHNDRKTIIKYILIGALGLLVITSKD